MEDYDKFVESRLAQLKRTKDVDKDKPKFASSLICFYGRPILPPLLTGPLREEMGRHRDAAQKAAELRKSKDDGRMAHVQTILHSVQLRKTPTLEELLQESDVYTKASSYDCISGSFTPRILSKDSFSSPYTTKEKDSSNYPLTSTTHSALLTSYVAPQPTYNEGSLINQQESLQGSQPSSPNGYSHQSFSSGYVNYVNVENTGIDTKNQSQGFFSSDSEVDNMGGFFIHNTSDTVIKMPDIINYPPVDGEELERSGQELPFGNDFNADHSESTSLLNPSSAEESCGVCPEQMGCKENTPLVTLSHGDSDQELELKSDFTDRSKDAQTSHCMTELDSQSAETIQVDEEDSLPSEEPYRMSLQALLKKSQEYRRRQRMLRSQAKNAKLQDRAQDQPRAKSEEQSLSDKENDEHSTKGTASELKKSQERSPSADQSLKRSYEYASQSENIHVKPHLTFESKAQQHIIALNSPEDDSTKRNNWLNATVPKDCPQLVPIWTENLNNSSENSANIRITEIRKYHTIPAPNVCKSPVHCKVRNLSAEPPFDKISQREALINKSMNKDHKVEEVNGSTADTSTLNAVVENDVTSVLAESSQHIDQLEFNLSGLKVLISDLVSTLTENIEKSSSRSENQQMQLSQNDSVCWLNDDSADKHDVNTDLKNSQSLDSVKNINDNTLPLEQETQTEGINLRGDILVKTCVTKREKEHTLTKLTNVKNGRKLSSAKCILSAAQRMRIPDVFWSCHPDSTAQRNVSVLSDTSNYPAAQKNDSDVAHDSRSPSLNQSYDVATPSELWLHDASVSKGHVETHLTPEGGAESQGSLSKVKRRLHMTEDVHEQGDNVDIATSIVSRPSSSTPKAAAQWNEGLDSVKVRQEQLRQVHAAQVKALQEEHHRQQEELLQALAARYRLLQSMSLPCSMSASHLGDTVTFPTLSQPSSPPPEHCRHLLLAVTKGFLTRRLLKTERVAQLVRTIRDTQQFLQACQQTSPNDGLCTRQDLLLQDRVTLQLRAARYEVYDIFFSLSAGERMRLISWDRDLARERELRRQVAFSSGDNGQPRGKSSLSAATQKSLERKRGLMIQKKTAERHRGAGMRTRHKPGFSAEQPLETQRGQFRANPQRVPKSTYTSRPR